MRYRGRAGKGGACYDAFVIEELVPVTCTCIKISEVHVIVYGCVQFYTSNDIIPLIMGRKVCTPTLFPASGVVLGIPITLPPLYRQERVSSLPVLYRRERGMTSLIV